MPELPEVETVRLGLEQSLLNVSLIDVRVWETRLRTPVSQKELSKLNGRRLESVDRRAKYLVLRFSGRWVLQIHLGMTGRLRLVPTQSPRKKHDHIGWRLDSGKQLRYSDPRRFGSVKAQRLDKGAAWPDELLSLGVEPLSSALTGPHLFHVCHHRAAAIKVLLLNQKVVAGVGNIYASEALFRAGINPHRGGNKISLDRYGKLATSIRETLQEAIAAGGTTLNDYRGLSGEEGWFARELQVYGREQEPCPRCHKPVQKIVQAQRSTFYCPRCQS